MAEELNDRLQSYLAAEEPRRPLFSASAPRTQSPTSILTKHTPTRSIQPLQTLLNRSPSDASTVSSEDSYRRSNTSSDRQSSISSIATSISVPPWVPPTFVQHFAMGHYNYGYDLPCEFFFTGCNLRFDPADFEVWISHTASHFGGGFLPTTAVCTFCDEDQATFHSNGDDAMNWRERMIHIGSHLEALIPSEHIRPDFWVIEHMWEHRLISPEDYAYALKGTERPRCDNTYPLDYETPDMLEKKEKALQEPYDMRNEERQRRKGKGQETHEISHPHRHRKSNKSTVVNGEE